MVLPLSTTLYSLMMMENNDMKKVIGGGLIAAPFIATFYVMASHVGLFETLCVFSMVFCMVVVFAVGIQLWEH